MNFFHSLPWNRGHPAPILNSFVVGKAEDSNTSNSGSPPSNPPSEDLSSADTFPENIINTFDALPAVSRLSYVPLASPLVARLYGNCFPIAALAKIHQRQSFPVPSHYESVVGVAAAVVVLATRANLAPEELTAEAILTFLWILQSFHSQYGSDINTIIHRFTELLGLSALQKAALRKSMIALQSQFLARLDWKIRLDDTEQIHYALKTLLATPGFLAACSHIENEAVRLFRLEFKQQEIEPLLSQEVTPSIIAPYLHVPVQFSSSILVGPGSFPIISSRVFPSASFVTPAVSHRSHPTSLFPLNLDISKIEEEEDCSLSDYEDIYSDLEECKDVEDEEDYLLAAGTAAAAVAPQAMAPLLGKRQLKPWENASTEEPPRKKLIITTSNWTRGSRSSGLFEAMSRPFLRELSKGAPEKN
ncbi:hypothetical protein Ndes2526B_g01415 [Nannochloris sp. 'desiccata']|nr:hypothetical protein KSW81_004259 [Chlorella desiccata (nom. nud.)]KAH7624161.1 hypothetical protein NADE_008973 [Chlorella desiccata (nom. nud.)]